jgi:hypothetical protein
MVDRLGFVLMEKFKSRLWQVLTAAWGLLALSPAGWNAPLDSLVQNSPFAPPTVGPASAANQPLEFRGVFADGGEFFFSIHDPAARTSHWVGLDESGLPYTVRSYDGARQTVVADFQGRSLVLTLKKAPVVAAVPVPAVSPVPAPPPAVSTTTSPPEEAARLAAIAAEIRRRRELRQKPAAMDPPGGTQP